EAEKTLRQLLRENPAMPGTNRAVAMNHLANVCSHLGKWAEAETLVQKGLSLVQSDSDEHYLLQNSLADIYVNEDKYAKAEPLMRECVDYARKKGDKEILATLLGNFGVLQTCLDRPSEAAPLYEEQLQLLEELYPPGDGRFGHVRSHL